MIRLLLFLAMVWIIYRLFVVDPTTGFDLKGWLQKPLFTIGESAVNSLNLLGSLVLLVSIVYLGRWAREVTYSWLYSNIRDLGVRNSLSVFTQYAVVVIGLLIALNIIGINLTSLTVFAGALGVGIGFGLQNIANNFISGLILLAERPVRDQGLGHDWRQGGRGLTNRYAFGDRDHLGQSGCDHSELRPGQQCLHQLDQKQQHRAYGSVYRNPLSG